MRRVILGLAVVVAGVFIVASAVINGMFLSSLGRTPLETGLFAAVSLGSDLGKAILPVVIAFALAARAYASAVIAATLLGATILLSVASGIGFASSARSDVMAFRDIETEALLRAKADLATTETRLKTLSSARSVSVIEEAMQGLRYDWRWNASKECGATQNNSFRAFCTGYTQLRMELAMTKEAAELTLHQKTLRGDIAKLQSQGAAKVADPQTQALSRLLGLEGGAVRSALMMLLAAVLELGSVTFLLLVAGPLQASSEPAPVASSSAPEQKAGLPAIADTVFWKRGRAAGMGGTNP